METLQSLSDIFHKKIFRIPDYQRGFAWGEKQLLEFWEDIMNLDEHRSHYTGVLSLKAVEKEKWSKWNDEHWLVQDRTYKPFFIVDGQQRLTTSVILIHSLIEAVKSLPENKTKEDDSVYLGTFKLKDIKENYIIISKPPQHIINTYLFGYESDNPSFNFLRHKIFNEPNSGTIEETFYTLNLENAKIFFRKNLSALLQNQGIAAIENLYKKLTLKMMFNVYEISDDFDVYVAFETMNNRGKKLSDLELLKNRLIYLTTLYSPAEVKDDVRKSVRDNVNKAWKEIYHQLGRNKNKPLNDDDFLYAHWIMYFKYSRKKGSDYITFLLDEQFTPKNVLQKITVDLSALESVEEVKEDWDENDNEEQSSEGNSTLKEVSKLGIEEINDYVDSLKEVARHWYNSHYPGSNPDLQPEEQLWIDKLNRIGIGYFRPLVVSSFVAPNVTTADRIELFKAIERFIFLAFRLGRAQANFKSSVYYNYSRELYSGETKIPAIISQLSEDLNWTFNEDGSFKYSFFKDYIYKKFKTGGDGFYGWNGIRYFLFEYEERVMQSRNIPKISWDYFVKSEKDKVSIEHIFPQTPTNSCWVSAFASQSDEEKAFLSGSLGNLLPLSQSINSSLQNDCFDDKKTIRKDAKGNVQRNGYENGSYSEIEVSNYKQWTAEEIKARGIMLLNFLETRWNVTLGNESNQLELLNISFLNPPPPPAPVS